MQDDLRAILRQHCLETIEGMTLRTGMYGRASELEAVWWHILWLEATLLVLRPSTEEIRSALQKAKAPICHRNKWPEPWPFHSSIRTDQELMAVLVEFRQLFFRELGVPTPEPV